MKDIIRRLKREDYRDYSSIPFWSWNNDLKDEELIKQIHAMKDADIHAFTMHARTGLKVEYLSEKWFHCIKVCLDEAKKLGMRALVYDENGWPSGFVGGRLLKDPANLAQYLQYSVRESFDPEAFAVYRVTDGRAERVESASAGQSEYHCIYLKSSPANTDILNPEVVTQFLDATYEEYYRRFGDRFGHELMGFFTDEPQFYRYETPYTRVAAPLFAERYGEDIRDGLVYLFLESEAGYEFRTRYYRLLNELYTNNYYKRLYDWCTAHGCEFTGHSVEETSFAMQMWGGAACTPSYEYETIPGIDHLGRHPNARLSAKQLGSAAQQLGKKHVLTETFGCCGWDTTPRELRLIGEAQYVRGVNLMCQHLSSYSLKGQGKVDHPPCFSPAMTWWSDYHTFNTYFNRLGFLLANSREHVNAVVINPMQSVYLNYIRLKEETVKSIDDKFAALQEVLTRHYVSYHLADETLTAKYGRVEDGKFKVGECAYNSVILPYCLTLAASTKKLLEQFKAAGGHIYYYDTLPAFTDGRPDDYSFVTEKLDGSFDALRAQEALRLSGSGDLQFTFREGDGYELLFCLNESAADSTLLLPEGRFAVLDLDNLTVRRAKERYTLAPGASLLLLKDYHTLRKGVDYTDGAIDITGSFVYEDTTDNSLPLDMVSVSFDGASFDEPHYVYEVFERLVKADYKGELWVKYAFEAKAVCSRIRLLAECGGQEYLELNGTRLSMTQSGFDVFFQEADLAGLVKEGRNELVYKVNWWQDANVRYALYDPEATESLRNCLAFDTEIEPVFLIGDFKVDESRALTAEDGCVDMTAIDRSGYPYFCGSKTFTARVMAEKDKAELDLHGRYMVCEVRVNGLAYKPAVLGETVPVTLKKGEANVVELTVTSSLRNMFGPHHLGCEPDGVSPACFTMRGTWENGESPEFHADYNTVPFGLTEVDLRYSK